MGVRLLTPMCAMVLRSPLKALRTWPLPLWCSAMRSMASAPPFELLPLRIPPSPRPSSSQGSRAATQQHQRFSSPCSCVVCNFLEARSSLPSLCLRLCMGASPGHPPLHRLASLYDAGPRSERDPVVRRVGGRQLAVCQVSCHVNRGLRDQVTFRGRVTRSSGCLAINTMKRMP